jgi:hypothetical protein
MGERLLRPHHHEYLDLRRAWSYGRGPHAGVLHVLLGFG